MKRFLLFTHDTYYPGGGWHDFKGDFDTKEEAEELGAKYLTWDNPQKWENDQWHIVDMETGEEVSCGGREDDD